MSDATETLGAGDVAVDPRSPADAELAPPLRETVADVVACIVDRFAPEGVVLFGSRASGLATAESDVDLMVVINAACFVAEQTRNVRRAVDQRFGVLRPRFDIKVLSSDTVRRGLLENDFFIVDVMTKGIVLAGRDLTTTSGEDDEPRRDGRHAPKAATLAWIGKAEDNHRVARSVAQMSDPPLGVACFHLQQSAEKYSKAFLQEREIRFPRTHNLDLLASLADGALPDVDSLAAELVWLTNFSVEARYPEFETAQPDVERGFRVAGRIRASVRAVLGLDVPVVP